METISLSDFLALSGVGLALGLTIGMIKSALMRSARSLINVSKMVLRQ